MEVMLSLSERNPVLFWFGGANLLCFFLFLLLSETHPVNYAGTNAWHKPAKFALSTAILAWSLGWYTGYYPKAFDLDVVNWVVVATLSFEVIYIGLQAGRGEASHYNESTPFHSMMFSAMALAATVATLAVAYVGLKFSFTPPPDLPAYYLWAIRLGILLFVIFSFAGFLMGARMSHTVGGPDGGKGLPFVNWSISKGDLRIAHFVGMHALQVLPILAWFILRDLSLTLIAGFLYALLAVRVLTVALAGRPLI